MRFLLLTALLLTYGCTTMDQRSIISPSESIYYKANEHYENKEFNEAITHYEKFLEAKPRSDLATPAKLNLGMSHYYRSDYRQAYSFLKELDIKDENIKAYIAGILKICEAEAGTEIKVQKQAKLAEATAKGAGGQIQINIIDAYLDDFGSVVLTGKTNRILTVLVEDEKIDLSGDNIFTTSVPTWKKGRSISVVAKDGSGRSKELDYFPDGESPNEPDGLREVNTTSNSAEIEWDENNEDDIKGYRLFYGLQGKSPREISELIEDNDYDVVGLASQVEGPNKTFEFFLRAVDKMGNESSDSDTLEVTIP